MADASLDRMAPVSDIALSAGSGTFAKATADKNPDNVQSHTGFLPTSHQSLTTSPGEARYAASIPELRYVACSELTFQRW